MNTNRAFFLSTIIFALIIIIIILSICKVFSDDIRHLLIGSLIIITGIVALIGFVFYLKSLKEPFGLRNFIAFFLNGSVSVLFLYFSLKFLWS